MSDTGPSHGYLGTATPARSTRIQRARASASDQRCRLLEAIVTVVVRDGYGGAKIGDVATQAGVSRATFYELFPDKEACFIAAQEQLAARVAARIEQAVLEARPSHAAHAAVRAIAELAEGEPTVLRFLTHEALLVSPCARAQHDRLLARLEHAIEDSWRRSPEDTPAPDIPARMLLGGAVRLLGIHIRRDGRPSEDGGARCAAGPTAT